MSSALPWRWRIRAVWASAVFAPLVHLVPLNKLAAGAGRVRKRDPGLDEEALAALVDHALAHAPWPWRHTCLKRCLVLYHLLRRAGNPAMLHIGVRRDAGVLRAHAWLTRAGSVVLERDPEHAGTYAGIASFPE